MSLRLPLNDGVGSRRHLEASPSVGCGRFIERLRLHPFRRIETIDRFEVVSRRDLRSRHTTLRHIDGCDYEQHDAAIPSPRINSNTYESHAYGFVRMASAA